VVRRAFATDWDASVSTIVKEEVEDLGYPGMWATCLPRVTQKPLQIEGIVVRSLSTVTMSS